MLGLDVIEGEELFYIYALSEKWPTGLQEPWKVCTDLPFLHLTVI